MGKIILASNSPRRKELLSLLMSDFEIITSKVEEVIDPSLSQEELVMELAFQKALDVFKTNKERVVLGFDTLVYLEDEIFGKPIDHKDAFRMLKALSSKTHFVITGCAIVTKAISKSFYSKTSVTFYPLTDEEIMDYINTKEPFDKAGAYAVQGYGSKFIKSIDGDYFTVVGMPLSKLYHELKELKII